MKREDCEELRERATEVELQRQENLRQQEADSIRRSEEQTHWESEERLAFALQVGRVGAWDLDLASGTANRSLAHDNIFGYSELLPEWTFELFLEHVIPEDRAMVDGKFRRAIETQSDWDFECRIRRADGEVRWIWAAGRHVRDDAGGLNRMAGVVQDITDRKEAEENLRETERKYRELVEFAPAGIYEVDFRTRRFLSVNEAMCQMLGYTREEFLAMDVFAILTEEGRARFQARIARWLSGEQPEQNVEYQARAKDGRIIEGILSVTFTRDREGRPLGAKVVSYDITERKRAERALFESQQKLQALMKALPVGVSFSDDLECKHITGNPALLEQFEITTDDNLSASAPDASAAGRQMRYRREGRELTADDLPLQRAVAENREIPMMELEIELPSGRAWFAAASGAPIQDANGRTIGGVAVTVDITQRREMENALRASEQRFLSVLDASRDVIYRMNVQTGRFDYVSPSCQATVGYAPEELMDLSAEQALEMIHPDDRPVMLHAMRILEETGKAETEYRQRTKSGEYRWFSNHMALVHDAAGRPLYRNGNIRDVTAQKQFETELRLANDELEQRVQARTVELSRQAARLRLLASELTLAEQRERRRMAKMLHDHLQQLLVGAKFRMTVLGRAGDDVIRQGAAEVEALLDSAIQSSRSLTAELSPPILHEGGLVAGLQWLVRWFADKHGLMIDLTSENEIYPLTDDLRVLLFESVRELLFNTVKHARTRSATVNVRRVNGSLQTVVADEGVGFDPETVAWTAESTGGFGLFNVRERLDLVGGRLEMWSEPGQGSRFLLTVPLSTAVSADLVLLAPKQKVERESRAQVSAPASAAPIGVLLVDDHEMMREGLAQLLALEADIEIVGQAADGEEAVRLASTLLPAVILMDMSMPKLNGVEATRIIHNEHPDIAIIGLSMFEQPERAQALKDAGAVDYLTKSGPPEPLLAAIRRAANSRTR